MASSSRSRLLALSALAAAVVGAGTCDGASFGPEAFLAEGTWGGDDAGIVATDSIAHVHFGCTYGDFPAPIELDADGRFSVSGEYVIEAYPVAVGPTMPAELAGVVRGRDLTMTVAVNDTVDHRLVVFGPTTVRLGTDPDMRMCPICAMAD